METELNRVVNALPGLVWTASLDGEIEYLNQHWFDYTGFSRDESYGRRWQAAIHPEELDETVGRWEAIASCGKPDEMVVRLRRFDGAYRRFLMRVSLLTDAAGQVDQWCGIGIDIEGTGPADAVRHLSWWQSAQGRENHFRAILDGLPALVTLMTPAGELEFANRQTLDYFGATLDEAKRWTPASTLHPDDRTEAVAAWVAVGRVRRALQFRGSATSGRRHVPMVPVKGLSVAGRRWGHRPLVSAADRYRQQKAGRSIAEQ